MSNTIKALAVAARRPFLLLAWLCTTLPLGSAQAQSTPARLFAPTLSQTLVKTGTSTRLRVAAMAIADSTQVQSVQAYEVDSTGRVLRTLGALQDRGAAGDRRPGDQMFGGEFAWTSGPIGLQYIKVALQMRAVATPIWSSSVTLETIASDIAIGSSPPAFERAWIDPESGAEIACDGLLLYADKAATDRVRAAATAVGASVKGVASMTDGNAWNLALPCLSLSALTNLKSQLETKQIVQGVEYQARGELLGVPVNDPQTNANVEQEPDWIRRHGFDRAWAITRGALRQTPVIAIIDTGVNYNHEDLAGRITLGPDFMGVNDNDPMDNFGHGTFIAAIAGARTNNGLGSAGAAPDAAILAVRVANVIPTIDHMCDGIDAALEQDAQILNLSLGTIIRSRRLAASVHQAAQAGRLLIAGVGNKLKNQKLYPAAYGDVEYFGAFNRIEYRPRTLAVGAVDLEGELDRFIAKPSEPGSNYGSWVDISASGLVAGTAFVDGGYITGDGTSNATAMVSGAAALVWSADPNLDAEGVRGILLATSQLTGRTDFAGFALRKLSVFPAVLQAAAQRCTTCLALPVGQILADDFPSRGARIQLGFTGPIVPPLSANQPQAMSLHGFAIPLRPYAAPPGFPGFLSSYELRYRSDLRTFDAYNASAGFFDLFAMTIGPNYFFMPLQDDARPQLQSYFARGGSSRINALVASVGDSNEQVQSLNSTTGPALFLNVVLDTQTPGQRDTARPSWGEVKLLDITPSRYE